MGNTENNKGMGSKGKSPSYLHISFTTKKLPSTLSHQRQAPCIPMSHLEASRPQRNQVEENLDKHE